MTSTSVGWVLLDGQGPDAATLDNDAFDVRSGGDAAAGDTSQHAAAVRGAQAIATASGHEVAAVNVTWTQDVEADGAALLKSLADLGFGNVLVVPLTKAAQAWGIEAGRVNEHHKSALCVLQPEAATVMVVATGAGTVRTAVIDHRETVEDLVESLRTIFRRDGWLPESLHLVGSRLDLDQVAEPIAEALPIPVIETVDTQLALARGAALAMADESAAEPVEAVETPRERERPWRVSPAKPPAKPPATEPATPVAAETVVAPAVSEVEADSTPTTVIARNDSPPRERPWVVTHAKKLTISAAAVAVCGAALSLAAGSALNVENVSAQAANPPAEGASVTSASVHPAPAPISAPPAAPVQPLAAEPPPAPPPPAAVAPPVPAEPLALPAAPVASAAPAPAAVPVPHLAVPAAPPAAPLAAPVAPPPAAPLPAEAPGPLVAPAPAAPALGAAPGPIAPPPAAPLAAPPAPVGAPPASAPAPADAPPPPDPVQAVLSPLFSGLP
jgi:hypothetical protein